MTTTEAEQYLDAALRHRLDTDALSSAFAGYCADDPQATKRLKDGLYWILWQQRLRFEDEDDEILSQLAHDFEIVLERAKKHRIAADAIEGRLRGMFARVTNRLAERNTRDILDSHKGKKRKRLRRRSLYCADGRTRQKFEDAKMDHRRLERDDARDTVERVIGRERQTRAQTFFMKWCAKWSQALAYCRTPTETEIVRFAADGNSTEDIGKMCARFQQRYILKTLDTVESRMHAERAIEAQRYRARRSRSMAGK